MLEEIGYGLQLERDQTSGESVDPDCRYRYRPGLGAFIDGNGERAGIPVHGDSLIALRLETGFDERGQREIKHLHRMIFKDLLEGRSLVSRSIYSQLYPSDRTPSGRSADSPRREHH